MSKVAKKKKASRVRPAIHVKEFERKHPGCYEYMELLRSERATSPLAWSDHCYAPIQVANTFFFTEEDRLTLLQSIVAHDKPGYSKIGNDTVLLNAFAAWKATQGIYQMDPALQNAVWNTPVTGKIPVEILRHMPEWCLYIKTPNTCIGSSRLHGFFVQLAECGYGGDPVLAFILDMDRRLVHIDVGLCADTLDSCIQQYIEKHEQVSGTPHFFKGKEAMVKAIAEPLISLVLYICSESAQVTTSNTTAKANQKSRHSNPRARMKPNTFAPTFWSVSFRKGPDLKTKNHSKSTDQGGSSSGKRPHVRRGHWHTVVSGPRHDPSKQSRDLRWFPPTTINVTSPDDLVPVIRKAA